jgi:hypothetical protein
MADRDRVYKCLNPVGIQDPVDLFPLARRLDGLDGKTIYLSQGGGGEQDILIPLRKRLQGDYPNVNWKMVMAGRGGALSEEEMKSADAVIRGVVW